jgi:hypothetical protein
VNSNELFELVKDGKHPVIKFTKDVYKYVEESVDPHMMGKIVGVTQEYEDSYRFLVDLKGFEDHNKSVACRDWRDGHGEPKLTWFETTCYPKDGVEAVYLPINIEVPLEIIQDNSLLSEYLSSKSHTTYVEWLEEQVMCLRSEKE